MIAQDRPVVQNRREAQIGRPAVSAKQLNGNPSKASVDCNSGTDKNMSQAKQEKAKDTRVRILLVDDHAVVRYGIAQLINRQTDMAVIGEEEDASKAMTSIASLKPDLVIADISLKDSSGLELMRNIKAQYPGLR